MSWAQQTRAKESVPRDRKTRSGLKGLHQVVGFDPRSPGRRNRSYTIVVFPLSGSSENGEQVARLVSDGRPGRVRDDSGGLSGVLGRVQDSLWCG